MEQHGFTLQQGTRDGRLMEYTWLYAPGPIDNCLCLVGAPIGSEAGPMGEPGWLLTARFIADHLRIGWTVEAVLLDLFPNHQQEIEQAIVALARRALLRAAGQQEPVQAITTDYGDQ